MSDKGQTGENRAIAPRARDVQNNDFVLEKSIFSNVFEKDIRRVYLYKKAERLAKAIHLVTPAFSFSPALRNRIDTIGVALVDAATLPPGSARTLLSRELLALSSILAVGRTGGFLSAMNADLIAHEAHELLQEVASYEEPRLFLDETPTLSSLAKSAVLAPRGEPKSRPTQSTSYKGHITDTPLRTDRHDAVLSVIRDKKTVYIKDISTVIRDVSEKTIQRELQKLIHEGLIKKEGSRRWTAYSLI